MDMRALITLAEAARWDPRFQFHWSVEPDLVPGKSFAQQVRTVSFAGARGDAVGDDAGHIYTTLNFRHWATQFFYEEVEDFPVFLYLVLVKNGGPGSIEAPHQDASPSEDVIVLAKVGEIDMTTDDMPDYGRMQWAAETWIKKHGAEAAALTEAVDVARNWKRFDAVPPGETVVLYHATKLSSARAIMASGFSPSNKVWQSSLHGYVYVGMSPQSLAMYGVHAARTDDPACVLQVEVLKSAIEPDDGKDWSVYMRNPSNKRDVIDRFGKDAVKRPSATVTLAEIGQARTLARHVKPIAILDLEGQPYPA